MPDIILPENKFPFRIAIIIYLISSVVDLFLFSDLIHSNDSFYYLETARLYALGQPELAVNGYWSPLVCWLLVPFVKGGIPLLGFKIINKFSGLLLLWCAEKWRATSGFNWPSILLVSFYTCILVFLQVLSHTETPDMLSASLLALMVYWVKFRLQIENPFHFILTGILCSVAYFAKYYNLYFAHILWLLLLLPHWKGVFKNTILIKDRLKKMLFHFVTFMFCVNIWWIALHNKTGGWRLEYSSKFNSAIFSEQNTSLQDLEKEMISPVLKWGIVVPEKGKLFSSPDEPAIYKRLQEWKPFSSAKSFNYQLHLVWKNFKSLYFDFVLRYLLVGLFFLWLLHYWFKLNVAFDWNLLVALVAYIMGYLWVFYAPRYGMVLSFFALVAIFKVYVSTSRKWYFTFILVITVIVFMRNQVILLNNDRKELQLDRAFAFEVEKFKELPSGKNAVLLANLDPLKGGGECASLFTEFCYRLKWRDCGVLNPERIQSGTVQEQLLLNKIDYVVMLNNEAGFRGNRLNLPKGILLSPRSKIKVIQLN